MTDGKLIGLSAIARRLGMSRQRASILAARDGFPAPAHNLDTGRVWARQDVENWIKLNPRYDHTSA